MSEKPEWVDPKIWDRIDSLSDDILVARVGPPHLRDFHLKVLFAQEVARAVKQEREECADIASDPNTTLIANVPWHAAKLIADAIRNRPKPINH